MTVLGGTRDVTYTGSLSTPSNPRRAEVKLASVAITSLLVWPLVVQTREVLAVLTGVSSGCGTAREEHLWHRGKMKRKGTTLKGQALMALGGGSWYC